MRLNPTRVRWLYILPSIFAFWFVGTIDKAGVSLVVTDHRFLEHMGLVGKPVEMGMIVTFFTIAYALANPLWGWVSDRYGPRKAAVAAGILWGFTCLLSAVSDSFGLFLTSRILLGAAEAPLWIVGTKFTSNWFLRREHGRSQAIWFFGNNVGGAVGALVLIAVMMSWGWRFAFLFMAFLALCVVVPMFWGLTRDYPEEHHAANDSERDLVSQDRGKFDTQNVETTTESVWSVLANWRYWTVVITLIFFGFIFFGLQFWLPTYLKSVRHFAPAAMAGWTSISWIIGGSGTLLAGYFVDKTGRATIIGILAALLAIISVAGGAMVHSANLAAALLCFGYAGQQAGAIATLYLLRQFSQSALMGRTTGIMVLCSTIIGGFSPTIMGAIVAASGGSYVAALLFLVASSAIAGIGYATLIRHEKRVLTFAKEPQSVSATTI